MMTLWCCRMMMRSMEMRRRMNLNLITIIPRYVFYYVSVISYLIIQIPKIMMTTRPRPSKNAFLFLSELQGMIPNSFVYKRGDYNIREICDLAASKGFTHLIVLNETNKEVTRYQFSSSLQCLACCYVTFQKAPQLSSKFPLSFLMNKFMVLVRLPIISQS